MKKVFTNNMNSECNLDKNRADISQLVYAYCRHKDPKTGSELSNSKHSATPVLIILMTSKKKITLMM